MSLYFQCTIPKSTPLKSANIAGVGLFYSTEYNNKHRVMNTTFSHGSCLHRRCVGKNLEQIFYDLEISTVICKMDYLHPERLCRGSPLQKHF